MGGAFDETGQILICDGEDILNYLNNVFQDPNSAEFKYAKSHNTFGEIPNAKDNYKLLIDAYHAAGVKVSERWAAYLKLLGTVKTEGPQQGPTNIYEIAQTRYDGLINNKGMQTDVHVPQHGGHVHTQRGSGAQASMINSPCPLPSPKS
jgi:hypothetical protein